MTTASDATAGGTWSSVNSTTAGARQDKALPLGVAHLQAYTLATPNGQKLGVMLEELKAALPEFRYDAHTIMIAGSRAGCMR